MLLKTEKNVEKTSETKVYSLKILIKLRITSQSNQEKRQKEDIKHKYQKWKESSTLRG